MPILPRKWTQLDGWEPAYFNKPRAEWQIMKFQMNFQMNFQMDNNAEGVVVEDA
jgi:hypothetical protein